MPPTIEPHRRRARKPTLSPTKIGVYLACRLMYKYTYVLRLSRFYYVPRAAHTFGAALHRALDEYHKAGGAETQSAPQLLDRLHDTWASVGYASAEEEQNYLRSAESYLRQYHNEHRIEGARTLLTEKQLRCDMGEFVLIGRIDRVDEHVDGRIEVIDYKSGRLTVEEEDVRRDLAMGIYAYLAHRAYPGRQICATIFALRTAARATACFGGERFAEIESGVRAAAQQIAGVDKDTEIEPVFLPDVCPNCDYLRLCARQAGWEIPAPESC